jgi:hypothetical protein
MANEPQTSKPDETALVAPEPASRRIEAMLRMVDMLPEGDERLTIIRRLLEFEQDSRLAGVFAASGQFAELKGLSHAQAINTAMAKIAMGRSWGLDVADSMQFIFFTNGRPGLMNEVISERLRNAGYDWDVQWHEEMATYKGRQWRKCIGCTLWPKRNGEPILDFDKSPVSISFTEADADNAEIWENGQKKKLSEKFNYKSWPRSMYYFRCIAMLKRFYAPEAMKALPMLVENEDAPPFEIETAPVADEKKPTLAERIVEERKRNAELFGEKPDDGDESK